MQEKTKKGMSVTMQISRKALNDSKFQEINVELLIWNQFNSPSG